MANTQDKNASQQEPICPVVVIEDRVARLAAPEPPIPDCDFPTCLRDVWKKFAERTALIDHITEERCTYGELEERCSRIANGLPSLGFGPGDMAGFYCVSSMSSIVAFYGVLLAGGRVVLAKSNLSQCELCSHLEDCHPSIVFCDDDKVDQVVRAQKEIASIKKVVVFGRHAKAHPFESLSKTPLPERQAQPDSADPNTLLLILCSSGTTGKPKKVMITHRNAVAHFISAG
ncbi:hypothetical protein HPB50_023896 [Hyalomma asiaticum]|uniref:Uncharacterized protein n=1 Tax=Hyalomma asiaticum TaxID=266040 RepID=A0ACB7TQE1_HYAAI|nr:hypothetical protein HPB50_023896 [Hyalomma asiaticum]